MKNTLFELIRAGEEEIKEYKDKYVLAIRALKDGKGFISPFAINKKGINEESLEEIIKEINKALSFIKACAKYKEIKTTK